MKPKDLPGEGRPFGMDTDSATETGRRHLTLSARGRETFSISCNARHLVDRAEPGTTVSARALLALFRGLSNVTREITKLCFDTRSDNRKPPIRESGAESAKSSKGDSRRKSRLGLVSLCSPVRGAFLIHDLSTMGSSDLGETEGRSFRGNPRSDHLSSSPLFESLFFNLAPRAKPAGATERSDAVTSGAGRSDKPSRSQTSRQHPNPRPAMAGRSENA